MEDRRERERESERERETPFMNRSRHISAIKRSFCFYRLKHNFKDNGLKSLKEIAHIWRIFTQLNLVLGACGEFPSIIIRHAIQNVITLDHITAQAANRRGSPDIWGALGTSPSSSLLFPSPPLPSPPSHPQPQLVSSARGEVTQTSLSLSLSLSQTEL